VLDEKGRLARDITFTSRGVLDGANDRGLVDAALDEARAALAGGRDPKDEEVEESVNQAVRRALGRVLGFRPVTETTLVRLGRPGSPGASRGRS